MTNKKIFKALIFRVPNFFSKHYFLAFFTICFCLVIIRDTVVSVFPPYLDKLIIMEAFGFDPKVEYSWRSMPTLCDGISRVWIFQLEKPIEIDDSWKEVFNKKGYEYEFNYGSQGNEELFKKHNFQLLGKCYVKCYKNHEFWLFPGENNKYYLYFH